MRLRLLLFTLLAVAFSPPVWGQSSPAAKTFTLNAANQCAHIPTAGLPTVGIALSGTASLTLQPEVSTNGSTPSNSSVTSTVAGSSPQPNVVLSGTVTAANSGYNAPVGGSDTFLLCVSSYSSGSVVIQLNPSSALNASLFGNGSDSGVSSFFGNTGDIVALIDPTSIVDADGNAIDFSSAGLQFPQPNILGVGTVTSNGGECANVIYDSAGGTVTAAAIVRTVGSSGESHDAMCVVTSDTSFPAAVGSVVFPYGVSFSVNSGPENGGGGTGQFMGLNGGTVNFSNNGGTNRHNQLNFRVCNGLNTACGTDMAFAEDPTNGGYEEYLYDLIGGNSPLYFGNILNSRHPGIYLGGADASGTASGFPGASLGLARPATSTQSDHLVRLSTHADMWNTATLSSGTVSVSFTNAFTSVPICIITWQGGGTLVGTPKCTPSTTGITISSTVNTDTAVFGYLILGNNN